MTLMFDVGNTELKMAFYQKDEFLKKFRFSTNTSLSDDELYLKFFELVKDLKFNKVIIASVVPNLTMKLKNIAKKYFFIEPLVLNHTTKTDLKILADNPAEVGADLVACSVAAAKLYQKSLVVDLGTAIKYLYVKDKTLSGVIISPGMEISLDALTRNTALLPKIDLKVPKKVLAHNTISCMQSGILYGTASQIDGLVKRIKKEVKEDFPVILTGGLSELILPILETDVRYEPNLIFTGLFEILNKNK